MRWIFLFIAVLTVCGGLEITYWRQTGAGDTLSGARLFADLFLLPIAIVGSVYAIHWIIRWRKAQHEKKIRNQDDDLNVTPAIDDPSMPWLHVHHALVQSCFNDQTKSIVEQLQTLELASIDPVLHGQHGAINTRRIDLEIDSSIVVAFLSDRATRIQVILQRLFKSLEPTLTLIAERIAHNQLMSTPVESHKQAVLHPAWTGTKTPDVTVEPDRSLSSWSKLSLQIICLLPDHISSQNQQYIKQVINQYLEQYAFTNRVQIVHQVVKDADECLAQFNQYSTELATNAEPRLLLLIGVDSTLDQEWLELLGDDLHTPSEAGFALLFSNEATLLADLPTIAHLSAPIWATRQKPVSAQGKVGADDLIAIIDELSHRYKMPESMLIPETGVLVTDTSVTLQSNHSDELSNVMDKLGINMKQIAYAGMALEQNNTVISGLTLALAVQQVLESQEHTLVLCSGSETVRAAFLVTIA